MKSILIAAALALACASPVLAQPVLAAKGTDVAMEELNLIWAKPGLDLGATIYRPKGAAKALPVLIDVHGGAWTSGDRSGEKLMRRSWRRPGWWWCRSISARRQRMSIRWAARM